MTTKDIEQTYKTALRNVKLAIASGCSEKVTEAIEQGISDLHDAGSPDIKKERDAILSRSNKLERLTPWYG